MDKKEIEKAVLETDEEAIAKTDWDAIWKKRYPILARYPDEVDVESYVPQLVEMVDRLQREQGYSRVDAFLVLKDILGHIYKRR